MYKTERRVSLLSLFLLVLLLAYVTAFAATNIKEAGNEMYKGFNEHKKKFTITIFDNGNVIGEASRISDEVKKEAYKDTGLGRTGDLVKYTHYDLYGNWKGKGTSKGLHKFDGTFTTKYNWTKTQKKKAFTEVERLKKTLKLNRGTKYQRIKRIHDYLATKVKYGGKGRRRYTPYGALIEKKAVCEGIALSFYILGREAGVPVRCVPGESHKGKHMWNIVKLGSKWYNIDVTWDSGRKPSYKYFLKGKYWPKHYPESEYEGKSFKRAFPMAKKNYK